MSKTRSIPEGHLLQLWITDKEWCSREDYEKKVVPRVRRYLKDKDPFRFIRCLVIMYGLPLKVVSPEMNAEERGEVEKIEKRRENLNRDLKDIKDGEEERSKKVKREIESIKKRISVLKKSDQGASLDSEIALVLEKNYSLSRWVPNRYFLGYRGKRIENVPRNVLMVSRLDGPSDKIIRKIIDDSIAAEKSGLKGTAYFDARWPAPSNKKVSGGALYDKSIHLAANRVKKSNVMPVVIDDRKELFKPGECPEAGLYSGWYSYARYVDAFTWQPGSVGFHIASAECKTLKRGKSQVWCKMMLEKGIAATLGPVGEPYVQAFPVPEMFFGLLIQGKLTLAECYALSNPFLSWKMVLIGDPLYSPFKNSRPKLKKDAAGSSPSP
ncbi:MAG: TIGR03790 family protein [Deltaproteobacteria bacterium]|nr:TIGR03790 family protein [Deltaproteobacteria bacterium]